MIADREIEQIRVNVDRSIQSALKLKEILLKEREALEDKDAHALSQCAIDKKKYVHQLEDLERQRKDLNFDELDPEPWMDRTQAGQSDLHNSEFPTSWYEFLDIVRTCNDLNAANGAIIRARQTQIQAAISLLRGGQAPRETYNHSGQNTDTTSVRTLAKA